MKIIAYINKEDKRTKVFLDGQEVPREFNPLYLYFMSQVKQEK